jgi:pterin-4a-carbinolamine dehydratase
MLIGWRKVTVSFTTHDAGSKLSAKDFAAAARVDALGYPRA